MIEITQEILYDFDNKIGVNVGAYLEKYHQFYRSNFPLIVSFFNGRIENIDKDNFLVLDELIEESRKILNQIQLNDHLISGLLDWELVEYLDDLRSELFFVLNIDKFLRSTINGTTYTTKYEFETTMRKETLEQLIERKLNADDYNNEWVDVAKRNDLQELDYDITEGGNNIILSIDLAAQFGKISGIVDNPVGEKVFGLDLQKKLEFTTDEDLKVLGYRETAFQSVEILANLEKGDVPEFLQFGRTKIIGNNLRVFALSSLVRQLVEVFSSDDTLTNFTVKEFVFSSDGRGVFLDFDVSTRLDLIMQSRLPINQ